MKLGRGTTLITRNALLTLPLITRNAMPAFEPDPKPIDSNCAGYSVRS
jgi:hypothetical protein